MISQKKDTSIIIRYFTNLRKYLYLLVILFVSVGLVRNIVWAMNARGRLKAAREKLEKLEETNKNLKDELGRITGSLYVEEQARDKLGLAREGDTVLVLPPDEEVRKFAIKREEVEDFQLPEENWKKWVEVFF